MASSFASIRVQLTHWRELVALLILNLFSVSLGVAGGTTDLQQDGLAGPVQAVLIEAARFSNASGQWIEEPRELSARITYGVRGNKTAVTGPPGTRWRTYTYNVQGTRLEEVRHGAGDTFYGTLRHSYDDKGLLTKTTDYSRDDSPYCQTHYTYDAQEQLTKKTSGCANTIIYAYDSQGNRIEEIFYSPSDDISSRLVHTYDIHGHRVSTTSYSSKDPGLGIEKVVTTYDTKGNPLEETTYYTQRADDPERPVLPPAKRIYTYGWDTYGNWLKQTETSCHTESGTMVCEPSLVTYRTITYYPQAAKQ